MLDWSSLYLLLLRNCLYPPTQPFPSFEDDQVHYALRIYFYSIFSFYLFDGFCTVCGLRASTHIHIHTRCTYFITVWFKQKWQGYKAMVLNYAEIAILFGQTPLKLPAPVSSLTFCCYIYLFIHFFKEIYENWLGEKFSS